MKIELILFFGLLTLSLVVCIVLLVISVNDVLYCSVFEKKNWKLWEKVCKELYSARFVEHYEPKENPDLECYVFYIHDIGIGKPVRVIYWPTGKTVSVHDFGGTECILSGFDKYHVSKALEIIKDMI